MDNSFRQTIYRYFDENGIKGKHLSSFGLTVDSSTLDIEQHHPESIFSPDLSQFKLYGNAAEKLIIEYVFETTNVKISSINELMKMRSLNSKPFFLLLNEHEFSNTKYCLAFGKIPGSVIFRDKDKIETLGNIEEIDGDLGFSDANIKDLGKLKKIKGDFWIAQYSNVSKLQTLSNLQYVGKDLNIKHTYIADLGNLEYVGGNLNLRNTLITDLGKLKQVGNNLLLPKRLKGIIKTNGVKILGKIKYYEDIKIPSPKID